MNASTYLRSIFPAALCHLKQWVSTNSYTLNPEGIRANGQMIADLFHELGFVSEMVPSENPNYGPHLFLVGGASEGETLCCVSHLDTVYAIEEELKEGFEWREEPESGRIYGPGTVDIKGGTLVIWMLMKTLKELQPELWSSYRWLLAFNASEEVRCEDFEKLVKERANHRAKAVLVFEGGVEKENKKHLVTARKGRRELTVQATGRGAHAGSAIEDGRNAVVALARWVSAVADISRYFKDLTLNLATFQGGTVSNRVPHEASVGLEIRAFEESILDEAIETLECIANDVSLQTEVELRVIETGRSPGWGLNDATYEIFQRWKLVGERHGFEVESSQRGGMSDANYLYELGPTLDGLGPYGENAHNSQRDELKGILPEYVVSETILSKAEWHYEVLTEWLSSEKLMVK